jgi:hypothetical protein
MPTNQNGRENKVNSNGAPPTIAVRVQKVRNTFHATAKEPVPAVSAVSPAGGMTITSLESVFLSSCQPRTTDPLQLL